MSHTLSPHTQAQIAHLDDAAQAELARPLSPREHQILQWIAKGYNNGEIAHVLGISGQTVKNHMSNILAKTGATSRLHLALMAVGRGWVDHHATFAHVEAEAAHNRELSAYRW